MDTGASRPIAYELRREDSHEILGTAREKTTQVMKTESFNKFKKKCIYMKTSGEDDWGKTK
jgi:hypothetical protein